MPPQQPQPTTLSPEVEEALAEYISKEAYQRRLLLQGLNASFKEIKTSLTQLINSMKMLDYNASDLEEGRTAPRVEEVAIGAKDAIVERLAFATTEMAAYAAANPKPAARLHTLFTTLLTVLPAPPEPQP
jgi:hypothetical protein